MTLSALSVKLVYICGLCLCPYTFSHTSTFSLSEIYLCQLFEETVYGSLLLQLTLCSLHAIEAETYDTYMNVPSRCLAFSEMSYSQTTITRVG